MHQSLHGVGQFHINSPGRDAGYHALIDLSDPFLHILDFFQLIRLPFRLIGTAFQPGGLVGHLRQNIPVMADPLFVQPAPELLLNDTMDLQVRIAPYGGSKMTILLAGQAKMPIAFGAVFGLFHAPQRQPADHGFLRLALHFL